MLKSKNNQIVSVHSSATQWQHRFNLEITLENGLLVLSEFFLDQKVMEKKRLIFIPRSNSNSGSKNKKRFTFLQEDLSWKKEVDEFANCICNDKKVVNGTLDESLKVMKLIEEIYSDDSEWYNKYVK